MAMSYKFDPVDDILAMAGDFKIMEDGIDDALEEAVATGAKLIEAAQRRLAPVRTGEMRSKIETYAGKVSKNKAARYVGINFEKNPDLRGRAVANEFGRRGGYADEVKTGKLGIKKKTGKKIKIHPMKSQPFIRPGFDSASEAASQREAEVFLDKVGFNK